MTALRYDLEPTPVGLAVIAVTDDGLVSLRVGDGPPEHVLESVMHHVGAGGSSVTAEHDRESAAPYAAQLREYFAGERRTFDLPIDWRLTRGVVRAALQATCDIPYGETASYGEVAIRAGAPGAARAVGSACAHSPFSIIVPVHRVVRADGSLGEYGGRPEIKRFLVEHELTHSEGSIP